MPEDLGPNGYSCGSRTGAEIYLRSGEDVLGVSIASSSESSAGNRHDQSQPSHSQRPRVYRLPATRQWQDDRSALFGASDAASAGLRTDDVERIEAVARSRGLHDQDHAAADVPHETRSFPRRDRKACQPGGSPAPSRSDSEPLWEQAGDHSLDLGAGSIERSVFCDVAGG